jgi:hypothetical protein
MKYLFLLCLILLGPLALAQAPPDNPIPVSELAAVREAHRAVGRLSTNTLKRRAYKKVVRESKALLEEYPDSSDRFTVLNLIFECQKELLLINNTADNREDVFATARALAEAPMTVSTLRLEADLLLMQATLAPRDVSEEQKFAALREMAERYLDSEAEATCLMHLILMGNDLQATDLVKELQLNLSSRFAKDPEVVSFLRERFGISKRDLRFAGTFRSEAGKAVSFPTDLIGHNYMICFWSSETIDLKKRFAAIKKYQQRTGGLFTVFSFNLDGLEDAGRSILQEQQVDWPPMHLPGGMNSKAFLGHGHANLRFTLLPVNAMGYSLGRATNGFRLQGADVGLYAILNDRPYLSLLQALSAGDFLISEAKLAAGATPDAVPADKLKAILAHFPNTQRRYRMGTAIALGGYVKAAELCSEVIAAHPDASDLWKVRNCRIIALINVWKVSFSDKHLNLAVAEAKQALAATDLPATARVIPQFCLAKQALRDDQADAPAIVSSFLEACGGDQAGASAYAAAAVLAVDGGQDAREIYWDCRERIYLKHSQDPTIMPVTAFLFKEQWAQYLFEANEKSYYFGSTSIYKNEAGHSIHVPLKREVEAEFTSITGSSIKIPDEQQHYYHFCVFIDLPGTGKAAPVIAEDGTPSPSGINHLVNGRIAPLPNGQFAGPITKEGQQHELLKGLTGLVAEARRKDVKLVLFFLSDDTKGIAELLAKYQIDCDAVSLPGGADHPILNTLGVYAQESRANTVVISPNGEFLLNYSPLHHASHWIRDRLYAKTRSEGGLSMPWFNPMRADQLAKLIKPMVTEYDIKTGNLHYAITQGRHADLFDRGSCCWKAFRSGWTRCRENGCCNTATSKGKVCLEHNPGAEGKTIHPLTDDDWRLAAKHLGLTFNDNQQRVSWTSDKYFEALLKSKDYASALVFVNDRIEKHKKPQYGIWRPPIGHHEKRAEIYDLFGEPEKAAADRKLVAEMKIQDAKIMADQQARKEQSVANQKAATEEKAQKEKAALEALRKKQEDAGRR